MKKTLIVILILAFSLKNQAQEVNPITTSLPFLLIPTDARSTGMGDVGVATSCLLYTSDAADD